MANSREFEFKTLSAAKQFEHLAVNPMALEVRFVSAEELLLGIMHDADNDIMVKPKVVSRMKERDLMLD